MLAVQHGSTQLLGDEERGAKRGAATRRIAVPRPAGRNTQPKAAQEEKPPPAPTISLAPIEITGRGCSERFSPPEAVI